MRHRWWFLVLIGSLWPILVQAQSSKRITTPTGYEDVYPGAGIGGRDSVFHRVTYAHLSARDDTIMVVSKSGERSALGLSYAHTTVTLELHGFKRWLAVLEYPVLEDRLMLSGWDSWLQGEPRTHLRMHWRDVAHVYRLRPGLEIELFPKLSE